MEEKIIHRIYLARGYAGQADSISVADLWEENQDAPGFFRAVLTQLVNYHIYDDSDGLDVYCFYSTSNITKVKEQIERWYARTDIAHDVETEDWRDDIFYA